MSAGSAEPTAVPDPTPRAGVTKEPAAPADRARRPRVAVLGRSWATAPLGEMAAAVRSVAGALSRVADVDVVVPGDGPRVADGAFDLTPAGGPARDRWPEPERVAAAPLRYRAVLVEAADLGGRAMAASMAPGAPMWAVGRTGSSKGALLAVDLGASAEGGELAAPGLHRVGLYTRVHPGASTRRHYGLRSTPEYLLVLGDRLGMPTSPWPSESIRWVLARFPRRHIVVVEGGIARVWRSRSCVAEFDVHTRMDLWILMARALGVVDLLPGDVFARECVEALRYGTPIAVPVGSAADGLARSGGGLRFSSTTELLASADALFDPPTRQALSSVGKEVADRWYGDPDSLVDRLAGVLGVKERDG